MPYASSRRLARQGLYRGAAPVTINNDPVVEVVVHVAPAEGAAYEARTKGLVSRLDVPSIQPGRIVPVRYDPQDRTRIALDLWECSKK